MALGARVPRLRRRGLVPQPPLRRPLPLRRRLTCPRWGLSPNPSASGGRAWSKKSIGTVSGGGGGAMNYNLGSAAARQLSMVLATVTRTASLQ